MTRTGRMYPVFLDLEGRIAVVVGAGSVALRKVETLLECGASVRVVGERVHGGIRGLAASGALDLACRRFVPSDLDGATLAFAATDDAGANAGVAAAARARGILVNAADEPDSCDFHVPSTVRRGGLCIAVSSGGLCPALAVRAREAAGKAVGPEYGTFLQDVAREREQLKARFPDDPAKRKRMIEDLLDSGALECLSAGDLESYGKAIARWKSSLQD